MNFDTLVAISDFFYPYALLWLGFGLGRNWDEHKAYYGSLPKRLTVRIRARRAAKGESA